MVRKRTTSGCMIRRCTENERRKILHSTPFKNNANWLNSLEIDLRAGDMLFLNNFAILHSRKSFTDSADSKRYLMRLWLHNPEKSWDLPKSLWLPWDPIFAPLREVRNYWDHDPFGMERDSPDSERDSPEPNSPPPQPPVVVFSTSCG